MERCTRKGLVEFPDGSLFRPWRGHKDGHEERVLSYYHPTQAVLAHQVHEANFVRLDASILSADDPYVKTQIARTREWRAAAMSWTSSRVSHFAKLFPLLLEVEDVFLPQLRGRFSVTSLADMDRQQDLWFDWQRTLDWHEVLRKHGWTVEEVRHAFDRWALDAFNMDPLREWFLLVRWMDPDSRSKLKGEALLAQEYYDVAYMLKWTFERAGGERLPDPDDVMHPQEGRDWKIRWYGTPDVVGSRRALLQILTEFGLNPVYLVHLILEGDTEEVFTETWAAGAGVDLQQMGIHIDRIPGAGGIKATRIRSLLLHAQEDRAVPYLIVDNDKDVADHLEDLKKLVGPRGWPLLPEGFYHVWKGEFEDDNFTTEEIVEAFNALAGTLGISSTLTPEQLDEAMSRQGNRNVSKVLKKLAWELYRLEMDGRRRELGALLAEPVARRMEKASREGKRYEPVKPIEAHLRKVLDIAYNLRSGAVFEWELPSARGST